MKNKLSLTIVTLMILLAVSLAACSTQKAPTETTQAQPTAEPSPTVPTYSDPFEYCAAVDTVDAPDERYTGSKMTDEILRGFIAAAGLGVNANPADYEKTTIWRCMGGELYTCNYGANLPCNSKANTDKIPTQAMEDYCKANPDANIIPMSITGHSTIYNWHCVKDAAELLNQIANVDAEGYLEQIWYPTSPNATLVSETPAPGELLGGSDRIVFASNRGGAYDDLYVLDVTNGQITRLTQGDTNTFPAPFSPDGSRILFTGYGFTTSYVGVMNADGTNPVNLTQAEVDEGFAAWSPDGRQIAFTSRRDGNNEIYVMNADGSGAKRLTSNPTDDFAPAWSPDGSQIAFVSDRDRDEGYYWVYIMNADGTHVRRLTSDNGINYTPVWSPDGKQIAYRSTLGGSSDIYLINVDGSGLKNLTGTDNAEEWSPAWSPDGKLIAFQTDRDGNWEIYVMNEDGSDPHNLTNNPADDQMPFWR